MRKFQIRPIKHNGRQAYVVYEKQGFILKYWEYHRTLYDRDEVSKFKRENKGKYC